MKNAQLSSHSKSKKKSNASNRPQKYNRREKLASLSNINFIKNSNYSLNKENISYSYNSQVKQISTNSSSNSLQKNLNKKKDNKDSNLNRQTLIKKCQIKFSSLYNNYLSHSINSCNLKSNISNMNKIRVNKNVNKVLSPINSTKSNNNKKNNAIKSNKNNSKFLSKTNRGQYLNNKNIMQYANYKDINYIKYININVDINKIKYIQCWWKYIYNVIFLQKNIRSFLVKIKIKQKLKYYNFIRAIIRIFFNSFINNMQISYLRKFIYRWKEIIYKRIIFYKLLSEKERKLFSINSSSHNSLIIDNYNYHNNKINNRTMTFGNVKNVPNIPFNNSSIFQEKMTSPFQRENKENRPMNVKINIKKPKNFACNLYNSKEKNSTLNKSLSNNNNYNYSMKKSSLNDSRLTNSNKRAKSNNKAISRLENKSFNFDEKTQTITNNLYKNIKEYYNVNDANINPAVSTINFYQNRLYKNISKKIKNSSNNFRNNNLNININNNAKIKKKTLISNVKNNKRSNFNDFYKNNKIDNNWIPYQNTFGNLNTNITSINYSKNNNNKIHSSVISPAINSNRVSRRNKNRSLEFDDSDINSIKFLLKYKRTFLHWKSLIFKNKIVKKLRLIQKIKHIIFVYRSIYIKIFFSKMIQNMYKNTFYQNKINFNYIVLNQYYDKLKEISKKKKLTNEMSYKYNKKIMISKKERNKSYKKKANEKKNNSMNSNGETNPEGLYYATQFNQKFNKLLNDKKGVKNNNIIIINNNINNNCQQLINNNIKQNKGANLNFSNNYYKKTGNNNSMIDIQPTDTSLNCTVDINNQSDKSSNSILINHINGNQKKIKNDKKNISKTNKTYYLNKMLKILINNRNKIILGKYLNKWKIRIVMKKCSLSKNNIIDEKIIYFPKSPNSNNNVKSHIMPNNYLDNQNNYIYNYNNNCNYTYDNNISTHNKSNSKIFFNNNDLIMQTMFTENNIKNTKNMYNNNPSLLRNKIFTPSNKYSFYTQYPNENINNINYIKPPRETEPKIVYHKKIFPSYASKNMKPNNNTIIIDYNYNRDNNINHNHKLSMNMNMNGINYGNNIISNFYSSNNFFNRRNNYHLENMNNILPEEKYGFKKNNKIEEREISFSPSLNRKNQSFKNVIKDNYQNINNNNIYINVVENFRSDFQNQNMNSLNDLSRLNYGNNCQPMNRSATEEDNLNKLMCHSHSQGFTKTIQSLFGH